MNYREKMKEYLKEPNEICNHYGKWGILNKEQRDLITRLLNEMDEADNYIKKMKQENARLKDKLTEIKEVIDKANKKLNNFIECCKAEKLESGSDYLHHQYWDMFERFNKQIKDILKEVSE